MVREDFHIRVLLFKNLRWKEFDKVSEKRRDSRGRILISGEIQKPDGRYRYKYTDAFGETKYVYSWRLNKNDPVSAEKRKRLQHDTDYPWSVSSGTSISCG